MGYCPSNCSDITLVANPKGNCEVDVRKTTPARILFFECSTSLPDPITNDNIKPYFDDDTIVASMELANVEFADPTYEEVQISDCRPPLRYVSSRSVTAEDRTAITVNPTSPDDIDEYQDYDFWKDKVDNEVRLNYMIAYCNGDVKIATDQNGDYLTASITAYINYQRPSDGNGKSVEVKNIEVLFRGDPLNLSVKPSFNLIEAGIML